MEVSVILFSLVPSYCDAACRMGTGVYWKKGIVVDEDALL